MPPRFVAGATGVDEAERALLVGGSEEVAAEGGCRKCHCVGRGGLRAVGPDELVLRAVAGGAGGRGGERETQTTAKRGTGSGFTKAAPTKTHTSAEPATPQQNQLPATEMRLAPGG